MLSIAACVATGVANVAYGAGFQLLEQNASALGNAYAGTAAAAEDASTVFFNPAGMTRLPSRQLALSAAGIKPSIRFRNQGSSPLLGSEEGGDAGGWALLPALYYAAELQPGVHVGIGVNSPFGLKTEYGSGWIGRLQGIKSDLKTININPGVSYQMNDSLSVGLGVSAERIDAELTSATGLAPTAPVATISGNDWGYGANVGVLWQINPIARLGAAYRSSVKHKLEGTATNVGALSGPARADVTMPATMTLSAVLALNSKWELLADAAWTQWSKFEKLEVVSAGSGAVISSTVENWNDTWRVAVGANYRYADQWKFRFGVAVDQSPVSDQYRTVRIPDNDRTWLAIGAQYKLSEKAALDVGYARIFVKDAQINQTVVLPVQGAYSAKVDILGIQYTQGF